MARDEEIFRRLKKQTPIVKRKDIQPLSSRDFDPRRSALDLSADKPAGKRVTAKPAEINVFGTVKRPASQKNVSKRGADLANRYNSARQQRANDLNVFGREEVVKKPEKRAAVREPVKERTKAKTPRHEAQEQLQPPIMPRRPETTARTTPETISYNRGYQNTGSMVRVDQHAIDYVQAEAQNGKMAFRHELKYYINYHDYVLLKNTIKPLLAIDSNAGSDGHYHIRSLYFDDIYETALAEKIAGNDERHKYRIRIYNYSDSVIRFEKKIKRGQFITKKSIALSREDCDSLIAGDCSVLEGRREPLANEIFLQMKNCCLRPRVIVDYWREAYVSPFENVRIAFDKDIKGGLLITDFFNAHAPTMPILDEGIMVLEVKFDRYLPAHIKAVLNNVDGAQRSAISKYVLCRKFD